MGIIKRLIPVEEADLVLLPRGKRPANPGEWTRTHSTSKYSVWVRTHKDGAKLVVLPTRRAFELGARHGLEPRWVGQCRFAFYVEEAAHGAQVEEAKSFLEPRKEVK